jgi:ABC-2 type transport system ATP-binding protein
VERHVIRLEGVSFSYRPDEPVLAGVDLGIPPGVCLVVGPNGCGKSTLLKLVAGVERPGAGTVEVHGHDLWTTEVAARRELAYVPEHPDLSPYATVLEILELVCGLRRQPAAEAVAALRWVGMERLAGRTVRELSKGQRRRAVLAAAAIGSPLCLVLDEPMEGMDRGFRDTLVGWVADRRAAGGTVLLVAHDFEPFAPLADRSLTVRDGRCRTIDPLSGDPAARLHELEELAGRLGTPPSRTGRS